MICPGIVTNVTNFGAFVDIGVHQDGLVHISELSHKFVDDPRKVVNPGDQVTVKVLAVDLEKNQISLSCKMENSSEKQVRMNDSREQREQRSHSGNGGGRPRGGGHHDQRGAGGGKPNFSKPGASGGGSKGAPPPRPSNPFNNPFAALGGLNSTPNKK